MAYNLTVVGNSTGVLNLAQNVNSQLLGGLLGTVLLIGLMCVFYMGFYWSTRDARQSAAATTWIAFLLAVLLRAMDLVPNITLFITLVLAGFAAAFIWGSDR